MRTIFAAIAMLLSFAAFGEDLQEHVNQEQVAVLETISSTYHSLTTEARRQVDCLADNIYFEAGSEPFAGQKAVAFVTLNRVASGRYPDNVCEVVRQKIGQSCQFSWWCNSKQRSGRPSVIQRNRDRYLAIRDLAVEMIANYGKIVDNTKGALYFHSIRVDRPYSRGSGMIRTTQIGQHVFYRTRYE